LLVLRVTSELLIVHLERSFAIAREDTTIIHMEPRQRYMRGLYH
jgi:hypothetical protein